MAKFASFQTDAVAVAGFAADVLTTLLFMREERGIAITDITAVAGAVRANDADWTLWVDGQQTKYQFVAEEIDPAVVGRNRLLSPIKIHPKALIQWAWAGQAVAQANILRIQYELI